MPTVTVAVYPGTTRLSLIPDASHQEQSSPEWGYSEPASLVTKNRIRMEHAHAIPVPALAPERSSLCR